MKGRQNKGEKGRRLLGGATRRLSKKEIVVKMKC